MEFNYVFHFSSSYSLYFSILRDFCKWHSKFPPSILYKSRCFQNCIATTWLQRCKSNIILRIFCSQSLCLKVQQKRKHCIETPHSTFHSICCLSSATSPEDAVQRTCLPSLLHPARISSEPIVWEITLYHTLCTRDQRLQRNAKPKQSIFLNIFIYYWSDYLCIYLLHIISPSNTHRYWS